MLEDVGFEFGDAQDSNSVLLRLPWLCI